MNTVSREQVRAMIRQMVPEFKVTFADERVDEGDLMTLSDEDVVEVKEDPNPTLSALDRLDRMNG